MAVPVRRTGKTRKNIRRGATKLEATNTFACPNCGAQIKPHKVCPHCGYYDGKKVMNVKVKEEE